MVDLGDRGYEVYVGSNIFQKLVPEMVKDYQRVFWIVSQALYKHHEPLLKEVIKEQPIFIVADGEKNKNITTSSEIYDWLAKNNIDRQSLVVALGGGVIGDLAGFVASTILRGVKLLMVPTTLLSQLDSSVGGKNGINLSIAKNMVGTFYQPIACIIDINFLASLPKDELVSGYAELLKHGLIKDKYLFDNLEKINPKDLLQNKEELSRLIYDSGKIKASVVEEDEKEQGLRAILNFGHTVGHYLEAVTGYKRYRHGECVYGGMGYACYFSYKEGYLALAEYQRIIAYIRKFFKPILLTKGDEREFVSIIKRDKKANDKGVKFIILNKLGEAKILRNTNVKLLEKYFIKYLGKADSLIKIG